MPIKKLVQPVSTPKAATPSIPPNPKAPKGVPMPGSKQLPFEPKLPPKVVLAPPKKPATAEEAIKRARELLEGAPRTSTDGTSVVTENAPDVNDPRDLAGKRADAAKAQLLDNSALEADALLKLSPKDRARYQAVKDALLADPKADPVAALALQTMLLEGKLPGAKALGGSDTLLGGLEKLTTLELGENVDRQQLLADLVQECATPSSVSQESKGTCVPTSIEIQLLQTNPAEYVRLVSGLASKAGEVTTVGGDVLKVEPDALTDDTGRSVSQRLLAPALMEIGNGRSDYDNTDDEHHGPESDGKSGLTAAQADRVLESLYGKDFAFMTTDDAKEKKAGTDFVMDELEAGRSVLVGLQWGDGGHKVLVVGTETRDGQEYVKIINPWGREESIPKDDFEKRLRNVNYDPNAGEKPWWKKLPPLW